MLENNLTFPRRADKTSPMGLVKNSYDTTTVADRLTISNLFDIEARNERGNLSTDSRKSNSAGGSTAGSAEIEGVESSGSEGVAAGNVFEFAAIGGSETGSGGGSGAGTGSPAGACATGGRTGGVCRLGFGYRKQR